MSDKYTVKESALANCNFIIYENGRYYITIYDKENAELFCKLLNDHEARKSLPKIDKDFKYQMIKHFKQESITESEWLNNQYDILVEILESLEAE